MVSEEASLRQAARDWAAQVFAAPYRFDELITDIANRDEILRRLATLVRRRTIHERRAPTSERRAAWRGGESRGALTAEQLDPFEHTLDSMRAATERVGACMPCSGGGQVACGRCQGEGRVRCPTCSGTGKQRSDKTGRPINCKTCRKAGHVDCAACSRGLVTCATCAGNGQALIWLAFEETSHWKIVLEPAGPVAQAHPVLRKEAPLEPGDVPGFTAAVNLGAQGPLRPEQLQSMDPHDRSFVETHGRLTARGERIAHQQYLRLHVPRRDLSYEMCGTRGTLVLSGTNWLGATTEEAKRPIRNRVIAWLAIMLVLSLGALATYQAFSGQSAYYDSSRGARLVLLLGSLVAIAPAVAGGLRSWRGGLRRWPMRSFDRWSAVAGAALFFTLGIYGAALQPAPADVREAVRQGNPLAARQIFAALAETRPAEATPALEDEVLLAEVAEANPSTRRGLLEQVVAHGGPRAAVARKQLLDERVAELRRQLAGKRAGQALDLARQWYPSDDQRPVEIKAAMADAFDAAALACAEAPCRLAAQRASSQVAPTPARQAALETTRRQLLAALTIPTEAVRPSQLADRLRALRKLELLAEQTQAVTLPEDELGKRAVLVASQAAALRAAVPIIGASREVAGALAEGLFEELERREERLWLAQMRGLQIFLSFDAAARCRGLYAVALAHQPMDLAAASALLARAVGGKAEVRASQAAKLTLTRWTAEGIAVAARGEGGRVYELRIGTAEPY